jgi:hypothetical protein
MGFGPDGGLYVSLPAISDEPTGGSIVRIDAASGETLRMPTAADLATTDLHEGAAS